MGTTARARFGLAMVLAAAALACDPVTSPSTIGTPPALDLSGTWTGLIGVPPSTVSFRATWTASQSGANVSGPLALTRPPDSTVFAGRLDGTVSGNRVSLTYTVPRGNIPAAPDCAMSGTGTSDASSTVIGGRLNMSYTNCQGLTTESSTVED